MEVKIEIAKISLQIIEANCQRGVVLPVELTALGVVYNEIKKNVDAEMNPLVIQIDHIKLIVQTIEASCQRGSILAGEMMVVGYVYNELVKALAGEAKST